MQPPAPVALVDSGRPLRAPQTYVLRALASWDPKSSTLLASATISELMEYILREKTSEIQSQRTFFVLAHLNFLTTIELATALRKHSRLPGKLLYAVRFTIEVLQIFRKHLSHRAVVIFTKILAPYLESPNARDTMQVKLLLLRTAAESAKPLPKHLKRLGTSAEIGPSSSNDIASTVMNRHTPEEVADSLAATESDLFRRISPSELVGQGWQQDDRWERAPNVCAMIAHYNNVTTWVASEILTAPRNMRSKRIKTFIAMVDLCISKHWYNTAMELIGGLNHGAISRQKKLWAELPDEVMMSANSACSPTFTALDELLSPQRNYNKLLTHINGLSNSAAVLPYLGIYLKELALIHAGNQSFLDEGKTKLNVNKACLLGRCIAEIMSYQDRCEKIEATLTPNAALDEELASAPFLTDESLWTLSEKHQERVNHFDDNPAIARSVSSARSEDSPRTGTELMSSASAEVVSSNTLLGTPRQQAMQTEGVLLQGSISMDAHVGVRTLTKHRAKNSRHAHTASGDATIKVTLMHGDNRETMQLSHAVLSVELLVAKATSVFNVRGRIELALRYRDASGMVLMVLDHAAIELMCQQRSCKVIVREC